MKMMTIVMITAGVTSTVPRWGFT